MSGSASGSHCQAKRRPVRAKAGLDFVPDQQRVVAGADATDFGEVARRREENAGLGLHGLHQDGGGLRGDG